MEDAKWCKLKSNKRKWVNVEFVFYNHLCCLWKGILFFLGKEKFEKDPGVQINILVRFDSGTFKNFPSKEVTYSFNKCDIL